MGTKNIAISDEAHEMPEALKRSRQSFTDVIERMTRRSAVLDLAGIVSKTEAASVETSEHNVLILREEHGQDRGSIEQKTITEQCT